jgi:hypothetical protein
VPKMVDGVQAVGADGKLVWDGLKGGGNMAAIHLANAVGGNVFLGFISAVAFATILAVVAGLTLSGASAVSHDLYATVFKHGNADSASELRVSKMTTVCLGIVAVFLGIAFEKENVAYMVMLAFAIACSANFPVLFMSVLWKDCTTKGAVAGGIVRTGGVGGADHPVGLGMGSRTEESERQRVVPVLFTGPVLDDGSLPGDLSGFQDGQQQAGTTRAFALPGPEGSFGNGRGLFFGIGSLGVVSL